MCIVVITARLGSKRLKKKYKRFFGKPVISYPIDVCKKLKFFKNVFVSLKVKLFQILRKVWS